MILLVLWRARWPTARCSPAPCRAAIWAIRTPRPSGAPRIGLCRSPSWDLAAPETAALLERVGGALGRAGAAVCERELPPAFAALVEAHPIVMNSESGRALGWELATARDEISPGLRERLEFGLACSEAERTEAYAVFAATQRRSRRRWRAWTCW